MKICFDMDGTIADLYGVENWLTYLEAKDPFPYLNAKPLLRLCTLARLLNRLQRSGYELSIISWLSKARDEEYDEVVTSAKMKWLRRHLPSVSWDEIHIIPYGQPKATFGTPAAILFDDEKPNRDNWPGLAFDVDNILEVLKEL